MKVTEVFQTLLNKVGLVMFRYNADFQYVQLGKGHRITEEFSPHCMFDIRTVQPFGKLAAQTIAERRTFLQYDRLYVIFQGVRNVLRLTSRSEEFRMVEVGVFRGGTSAFLARTARALEIRAFKLYSVDTFEGHDGRDVNTAIDHPVHHAGFLNNTGYEEVCDYLKPFFEVQVLKGRIQDQCDMIGDAPIHFVHIDVDLYEPTVFCLDHFVDLLVNGGVIVVDDYGSETCPGIKKAVERHLQMHPSFIGWHMHTEQFVLQKMC
jgi:hypothetical protein